MTTTPQARIMVLNTTKPREDQVKLLLMIEGQCYIDLYSLFSPMVFSVNKIWKILEFQKALAQMTYYEYEKTLIVPLDGTLRLMQRYARFLRMVFVFNKAAMKVIAPKEGEEIKIFGENYTSQEFAMDLYLNYYGESNMEYDDFKTTGAKITVKKSNALNLKVHQKLIFWIAKKLDL